MLRIRNASRRSIHFGVFTSIVVLLAPLTGWGGIVPLGTEFQVNTYTPLDQLDASVARGDDGGFVVVWTSTLPGVLQSSVVGQRYASTGTKVGTEFQINTYTPTHQQFPAVARTDGGFVAVWASVGQDTSGAGVFGQRYASNGTALGTEFRVNTFVASAQIYPAVASDDAGNFVVVWKSAANQDGFADGVFGQRYASDGTPRGTEFQVNTYTLYFQDLPAVAADSVGNFTVVWQSGDSGPQDQDGYFFGVFGQRFASDGTKLGTEFQVNTYTPNTQTHPDIADDGQGNFVVVWESNLQDTSLSGIFGQRFTSGGGRLGTEFQISTYTPGLQSAPAVTRNTDGSFVVAAASLLRRTAIRRAFSRSASVAQARASAPSFRSTPTHANARSDPTSQPTATTTSS